MNRIMNKMSTLSMLLLEILFIFDFSSLQFPTCYRRKNLFNFCISDYAITFRFFSMKNQCNKKT